MKLEFYAVFRDDDGNVTGVTEVSLPEYESRTSDGFRTLNMPAIPAGGELTVNAEVFEVFPGKMEIALNWNQMSQNYGK